MERKGDVELDFSMEEVYKTESAYTLNCVWWPPTMKSDHKVSMLVARVFNKHLPFKDSHKEDHQNSTCMLEMVLEMVNRGTIGLPLR